MSFEINPKIETKTMPPWVFKLEISNEDYDLLVQKFKNEKETITIYTYFDTSTISKDAQLFNKDIRLRVRSKNDQSFFEIKVKHEGKTIFEASDIITENDFDRLVNGEAPNGIVNNKLIELGLEEQLYPVGVVKSIRKKIDFHNGKLILENNIQNTDAEVDSNYKIEFRSNQSFSDPEIKKFLKEELGISETHASKSKLKDLWKNKQEL